MKKIAISIYSGLEAIIVSSVILTIYIMIGAFLISPIIGAIYLHFNINCFEIAPYYMLPYLFEISGIIVFINHIYCFNFGKSNTLYVEINKILE